MKLATIVRQDSQLEEALDQAAQLCVEAGLDLIPDEWLLQEGFLSSLKGLGQSALAALKTKIQAIKASPTPWGELVRQFGIDKAMAKAKQAGISAKDFLIKASAAANQGRGGYGGGGGGGGRRSNPKDDQDALVRFKTMRKDLEKAVMALPEQERLVQLTQLSKEAYLLIQKIKAAQPAAPHPASKPANL